VEAYIKVGSATGLGMKVTLHHRSSLGPVRRRSGCVSKAELQHVGRTSHSRSGAFLLEDEWPTLQHDIQPSNQRRSILSRVGGIAGIGEIKPH
jgi:hypothetical protein